MSGVLVFFGLDLIIIVRGWFLKMVGIEGGNVFGIIFFGFKCCCFFGKWIVKVVFCFCLFLILIVLWCKWINFCINVRLILLFFCLLLFLVLVWKKWLKMWGKWLVEMFMLLLWIIILIWFLWEFSIMVILLFFGVNLKVLERRL